MRTRAAFAVSAFAFLVGATDARAQEGDASPVEVAPVAPVAPTPVAVAPPRRDTIAPAPAAVARAAARPKTRFYVGGGGGAVFGRYSDPKLVDDRFKGVTTELHAGVAMTPWLGVGLEFATFYDEVTRTVSGRFSFDSANAPAPSTASLAGGVGARRLAVECSGCGALPGGGAVVQQALHLHTFGPRIDFAPDPSRGVYGVLNSGLSVTQDLTDRTGFVVGLRGGYRFALSRQVGFALEGGTSAQRYSGSYATFGFGGLQLQLRI
jgi:hypothetical protein